MRATPRDLDKVVRLGVEFHAASPHRIDAVDPDGWADTASKLIESGGVFVSDGGMIGGVLAPLYFNPSVVYAYELFWWAPDGNGLTLQREFRAWAKEQGAAGIHWTALADDNSSRMDRIYARCGAVKTEVAYRERF